MPSGASLGRSFCCVSYREDGFRPLIGLASSCAMLVWSTFGEAVAAEAFRPGLSPRTVGVNLVRSCARRSS